MKFRSSKLISSRHLRVSLGVAIGGISLYLAVRNVSLQDVKDAFLNADLALVGWALASVAVTNLAKAVRWQVLMGPQRSMLSLKNSLMVVLAGQALNTVYPARVGDLTRAYLVGGLGPGNIFVLGTLVLEKMLDTLAYTLLFFLLFLWIPLPKWIDDSIFTVAFIALLGSSIVFLVAYRIDWFARISQTFIVRLPERIRAKAQSWLNSGLSSLAVLQNRSDLVRLGLWTILVWVTAVLTNHLTLLALQIHLPATAAILVLIVLQVSITLPSIPGRVGIFEYLCVLSLAVFGIDRALGFSYGILLHVIALLPQTILGLIFMAIYGPNEKRSLSARS